MASIACPICGADLDALPADAPCPACKTAAPPASVSVWAYGPANESEINALFDRAMAELTKMSPDAARATIEEAKRRLESGLPMAREGEDPGVRHGSVRTVGHTTLTAVVPAEASTWRTLLAVKPDEVRRAVLQTVLNTAAAIAMAQYGGHSVRSQVAPEQRDAVPTGGAAVERQPTPAPPLVTPADGVMEKLLDQDMEHVRRVATCALPVMFVSGDYPDLPGIHGTCTAVRYRNEVVFVTAAHVVERNDPRTAIYVPLAFSGLERRSHVKRSVKPRAAPDHPDAPVDLAILYPACDPEFSQGESTAHAIPPYARMEGAPPKAPFAIAGFPLAAPDRNYVDHEARVARFGLQVALGRYEGPSSMTGLHTLVLCESQPWGSNGFSGGPAFRLIRDAGGGAWTPAFAGIVTNGGAERVHFVDAAFVIGCLYALNVGG